MPCRGRQGMQTGPPAVPELQSAEYAAEDVRIVVAEEERQDLPGRPAHGLHHVPLGDVCGKRRTPRNQVFCASPFHHPTNMDRAASGPRTLVLLGHHGLHRRVRRHLAVALIDPGEIVAPRRRVGAEVHGGPGLERRRDARPRAEAPRLPVAGGRSEMAARPSNVNLATTDASRGRQPPHTAHSRCGHGARGAGAPGGRGAASEHTRPSPPDGGHETATSTCTTLSGGFRARVAIVTNGASPRRCLAVRASVTHPLRP